MKILIIHYRYYESSGPENYLFNISKILAKRGHIIIPFSINYPENKSSEYSKYFVEPQTLNFHLNKNKKSLSFRQKIKIIRNSFYNHQAYTNLNRLIQDEKPDIAYVLQYGTKLSISIFDVLHKNNIPVILRVSDFNLICAKNVLFRDGSVCTRCTKNKLNSVIYKCVHDDYLQSLIYYFIQIFNKLKRFEKKIDVIITPSKFTLDLLSKTNQFRKCNFKYIPTFSTNKNAQIVSKKVYTIENELNICYVGRIDDDKGIDIMIDALNILRSSKYNIVFDIYGNKNNEYAHYLKRKVIELDLQNVHFKGYFDNNNINQVFSKYHFSVIPSKWYDNMPNSLIESCQNGVPVIAAEHGSLKELVKNGYNGFTFKPCSSEELAKTIKALFSLNQKEYNELSYNSQSWINEYCDIDIHYNRLIAVMKNVIDEKDC